MAWLLAGGLPAGSLPFRAGGAEGQAPLSGRLEVV
jgi:hypothetical protein